METNNKLLREALIKIRDLTEPCEGVTEVELIINDIAISALAAPTRNCDVGTAEEQAQRFNDYCHKQGNSCCIGRSKGACPIFRGYKVDCAIVWSQTPYVQEGGAK